MSSNLAPKGSDIYIDLNLRTTNGQLGHNTTTTGTFSIRRSTDTFVVGQNANHHMILQVRAQDTTVNEMLIEYSYTENNAVSEVIGPFQMLSNGDLYEFPTQCPWDAQAHLSAWFVMVPF